MLSQHQALADAAKFVRKAIDAGIGWKADSARNWLRVARRALARANACGPLEGFALETAAETADLIGRVAAVLDPEPADPDDIDIRLTLLAEAIEVADTAYADTAAEELAALAPDADPETRGRIHHVVNRARQVGRA